jgi:hypothetical protein
VIETVTLVSSSDDSTKVGAVEGSGSPEKTDEVDCATSDKKTSASAAVTISAESSHTSNGKAEKILAASEKQSSCNIRQEGIEKVGTLFAFLGFCCSCSIVPYLQKNLQNVSV